MSTSLNTIIGAVAVLGGLGLFFGVLLVVAARKFAVDVDARVSQVESALPGLNCGVCGHPGCFQFAEAVVRGDAEVTGCKLGGLATSEAVAAVMGFAFDGGEDPGRAYLMCQGGKGKVKERYEYIGANDCHMAAALGGGPSACDDGCIGFGSCVPSCPLDLISMGEDNLPVIDSENCTGCGECVRTCPKSVIALQPFGMQPLIACNSLARGKAVKEVCSVGCISCQKCVKDCPEGAIYMDETKALAKIDYSKCTNCGKCIDVCPTSTILSRQLLYVFAESPSAEATGSDAAISA